MSISVGIGLAFVAMLSWGVADFLIQRSVRRIGNMEALWFVSAFFVVVLFPFIYEELFSVFSDMRTAVVVLAAGAVIFVAAILDFEALKKGKLSVVEPIFSLETIASVILASFVLHERLTGIQLGLIALLLIGLVLVSTKYRNHTLSFFERGALVALLAAGSMGVGNFLVGWGSRLSDPLVVNFMTGLFIVVFAGIHILSRQPVSRVIADFRNNLSLLLMMSVTDLVAWVAFAFSMTLVPIGVAVALSESYIIVAVILGLLVNNEKLQKHQKIGLIIALIAAVVLASITA